MGDGKFQRLRAQQWWRFASTSTRTSNALFEILKCLILVATKIKNRIKRRLPVAEALSSLCLCLIRARAEQKDSNSINIHPSYG